MEHAAIVHREVGPMRSGLLVALAGAVLLGSAPSVHAENTVGTFRLDGLSYVSFGDQQFLFPATGSTIRFHFGNANEDGSIPFTIDLGDVSIAPIPLPSGQGTLRYTIAAPAFGFLRPTETGRKIEFNAAIAATLDAPEGSGTYTYSIPFTTETAAASNVERTDSVSVSGMRLVDGVWYAQIVGATTNKENAYPAPGAAVYTVLSGQFDQVP
jgi:hypothetical protein